MCSTVQQSKKVTYYSLSLKYFKEETSLCFNQAEARNTNLFFPLPLKKLHLLIQLASFILEQINSVLIHVSKSLGLVPSSHPDQLEILRSSGGPWLGGGSLRSSSRAFPGHERRLRKSQVRDGPLHCIFYKVLCGQLTLEYGSGVRLHSCW